jgi:hypothetical protein
MKKWRVVLSFGYSEEVIVEAKTQKDAEELAYQEAIANPQEHPLAEDINIVFSTPHRI